LILGASATLVLNACVTVDSDRLAEALATLNYDLEQPPFSTNSLIKFDSAGGCRVVHVNTWATEPARKKGYSRAVTSTPFNLRDVAWMEHLATHDEHYKDHTEHWLDHIRVAFLRPVTASFEHTTLDGAMTETSPFESSFVTVDTLNATPDQIADITEELRATIELCGGLKSVQIGGADRVPVRP
jgi:hypothetical protein